MIFNCLYTNEVAIFDALENLKIADEVSTMTRRKEIYALKQK